MTSPEPRFVRLDFVGGDEQSGREHCPAVFVDPMTGDFLFQGRVVTDPAVLEMLAEHAVLASDEAVVWLPARMRQVILDALTGYEEGRQGHGTPTFEQMLAGARRSAITLRCVTSTARTRASRRGWAVPPRGWPTMAAGGTG